MNRQTNWTSGPLDWMAVSSSGGASFHLFLIDPNGRKIGVCWGPNAEKQANAHLWSSAPDLYEALVAFMKMAWDTHHSRPEYDQARAAIAKATGETS